MRSMYKFQPTKPPKMKRFDLTRKEDPFAHEKNEAFQNEHKTTGDIFTSGIGNYDYLRQMDAGTWRNPPFGVTPEMIEDEEKRSEESNAIVTDTTGLEGNCTTIPVVYQNGRWFSVQGKVEDTAGADALDSYQEETEIFTKLSQETFDEEHNENEDDDGNFNWYFDYKGQLQNHCDMHAMAFEDVKRFRNWLNEAFEKAGIK